MSAFSMRALAEKLGVKTASLYAHIKSMDALFTQVGLSALNDQKAAQLAAIQGKTGNSASHGWGSAGSNGAQAEFTANAQTLEGDIIVDSISTLELTLTGGSSLTGTVNIVENAQGGAAVGSNAAVTIDSGCTWTLTGDCVISSLVNSGTINFNGYTITLADGTVLR